jgi:hypothetical protein
MTMNEKQFLESLETIASAQYRGEVSTASAEIKRILSEGTPEMKGQALFYRGTMRKDEGAMADAKDDWLLALEYARDGTFLRYELEQHIGEALESLHMKPEAADWYRRALMTCSTGDEFSGNPTLTSLLRISEGQISPQDAALAASVLEKSWRVLELPGKPDVTHLAQAIDSLTAGFNVIIAQAKRDD